MGQEWNFSDLPVISEAVSSKVLAEIDEFGKLGEEAMRDKVNSALEAVAEDNPQLAGAVRGTIEGALEASDFLADKLSHREWKELEFVLQYSQLVVLRALNEAIREKEEKI